MLVFFTALFRVSPVQAEMDPKLKVLMTTAGYGTVGGALLGTALMAFGTNSRSIFQGASVGLYSGLIFGGYIIYSHSQRRNPAPTPQTVPYGV